MTKNDVRWSNDGPKMTKNDVRWSNVVFLM